MNEASLPEEEAEISSGLKTQITLSSQKGKRREAGSELAGTGGRGDLDLFLFFLLQS